MLFAFNYNYRESVEMYYKAEKIHGYYTFRINRKYCIMIQILKLS